MARAVRMMLRQFIQSQAHFFTSPSTTINTPQSNNNPHIPASLFSMCVWLRLLALNLGVQTPWWVLCPIQEFVMKHYLRLGFACVRENCHFRRTVACVPIPEVGRPRPQSAGKLLQRLRSHNFRASCSEAVSGLMSESEPSVDVVLAPTAAMPIWPQAVGKV